MKQYLRLIIEVVLGLLLAAALAFGYWSYSGKKHIQHDLAAMQHDGAVAIVERLPHRVRHHQRRQAVARDDLLAEPDDLIGALRVERGGRGCLTGGRPRRPARSSPSPLTQAPPPAKLLVASTTAATMATRSSTETISNGSKYWFGSRNARPSERAAAATASAMVA